MHIALECSIAVNTLVTIGSSVYRKRFDWLLQVQCLLAVSSKKWYPASPKIEILSTKNKMIAVPECYLLGH